MDNPLKKFYRDNSTPIVLHESAKERVKKNILANLDTQVVEVPVSFWEKMRFTFTKSYVLAPLVFVLFLTGTGIASANSIPGDTLYGVKRKIEDARVFVAPNKEAKIELQVNFAEKRLEELEKIRSASQVQKHNDEPVENTTPTIEVEEDLGEDVSNKKATPRVKARQQADNAYKFLKEVEKENKSEEFKQRLQNFNERLNSKDNRNNR